MQYKLQFVHWGELETDAAKEWAETRGISQPFWGNLTQNTQFSPVRWVHTQVLKDTKFHWCRQTTEVLVDAALLVHHLKSQTSMAQAYIITFPELVVGYVCDFWKPTSGLPRWRWLNILCCNYSFRYNHSSVLCRAGWYLQQRRRKQYVLGLTITYGPILDHAALTLKCKLYAMEIPCLSIGCLVPNGSLWTYISFLTGDS